MMRFWLEVGSSLGIVGGYRKLLTRDTERFQATMKSQWSLEIINIQNIQWY